MSLMFFGLGGIIQVGVLLINAIAILSEDRFLARIGWSTSSPVEPSFGGGGGGVQDQSVKLRLITLIASVRTLLRIPLIGINTLIIIWALLLG